jgi:hypothetical protein
MPISLPISLVLTCQNEGNENVDKAQANARSVGRCAAAGCKQRRRRLLGEAIAAANGAETALLCGGRAGGQGNGKKHHFGLLVSGMAQAELASIDDRFNQLRGMTRKWQVGKQPDGRKALT